MSLKGFWLPCSPISPDVHGWGSGGAKKFQLFSLVTKTKLVQNVTRMSERQKDMPKDRLTGRQIEDKTTFQLSYQNKSCSECQQDVKKLGRLTGR